MFSITYRTEREILLKCLRLTTTTITKYPDSKVHGAYMGPTWGRQDPGGPHAGPMILALWVGHLNRYSGEYSAS